MSLVDLRFCVSGYTGTVRYAGPVAGTSGEWLGVEWDDPSRGKHDGLKDGTRYFTCVVPNSGSFIRNTPAIDWGRSFLEALRSKYIEDAHSASGGEYVTLGSSNGVIEVEAVGLDKIRRNLAQLEHLRVVSLDNERVSSRGPAGEIQMSCPNLRRLDLTKSLISSWDVVTTITSELRILESFSFNHNRFSLLKDTASWQGAFDKLQDLQLNWTMLSVDDLMVITSASFMPQLSSVEFGYNHLGTSGTALPTTKDPSRTKLLPPAFETLNLDSNELSSWPEILSAIKGCSNLHRLLLTSNRLESIPPCPESENEAKSLASAFKQLSLVDNPLKLWSSIDALASWCPSLENLSLVGTPLADDKHARQLVIAKIPSLRILDASRITEKERVDCELFYISQISREADLTTDEARKRAHPQWNTLCEKHGRPEAPVQSQKNDHKLSSRLIEIHLVVSPSPTPPPTLSVTDTSRVTLRVLPTMSIRTFGLKASKSLKIPPSRKPALRFWVQMSSFQDANKETRWVELDTTSDSRDLVWLGLDDGSVLAVYINEA